MSVCVLYRGGLQPAELGCGGPLPWCISGGMDKKDLIRYYRFCPQCGGNITVSDKTKPAPLEAKP